MVAQDQPFSLDESSKPRHQSFSHGALGYCLDMLRYVSCSAPGLVNCSHRCKRSQSPGRLGRPRTGLHGGSLAVFRVTDPLDHAPARLEACFNTPPKPQYAQVSLSIAIAQHGTGIIHRNAIK